MKSSRFHGSASSDQETLRLHETEPIVEAREVEKFYLKPMDIRFKLSLPSISRSFRVKFMRFWALRVAASLHCFGSSLGWRCLQVDRFFHTASR